MAKDGGNTSINNTSSEEDFFHACFGEVWMRMKEHDEFCDGDKELLGRVSATESQPG